MNLQPTQPELFEEEHHGGHPCQTPEKDNQPHSLCGCHSPAAPSSGGTHSCGGGCRGIRTPRRVHASLGLLLTLFLFMHLGVASLGLLPARYDAVASALHHLSKSIPVVEALLLLLIGAQTAVGVRLLIRSGLGYRSTRCKDDGRFRYFLQRWSALLLLVFIAVHLAMFKLWPGGTTWVAVSRRFTLGGSRLMISFYALVVIGIAFHAGNGLWTGASVWGQRDKCPRLWLAIAGASGALVAVLGFTALRAFAV